MMTTITEPAARIHVVGDDTPVGRALVRAFGQASAVPAGTGKLAAYPTDYIVVAAGRSGGIQANQHYPADLMLDNLLSAARAIDTAFRQGVTKLLYLASSCVYPKYVAQPLRVESLMSGRLEPTNEAYATAKLAGIKLCQAYRQQHGVSFISAIPASVFGPHDDFSDDNSHVIPGLMRRLHQAKLRGDGEVTVWGTGAPRREFIFARDLADACLFLLEHYDEPEPINVGVGQDWSIAELARMIAEVVGYHGRLRFDGTKPDGVPRKLLDSSRLFDLGWRPRTDFRAALRQTYAWFCENWLSEHQVTEDAHARAHVRAHV